MANGNWKETMKPFRRYIDPEMEERLKWIKIGNFHTQEQPLSPLQSYQRFWDSFSSSSSSSSSSSLVNNRLQIRAPPPPPPGIFSNSERQRVRKNENKLKRALKLVKSINQNREGNLKKKTELTQLLEEISKDYQAMYALYDNLTSEVRRLFGKAEKEEGSSSSSSSGSNSDSEYLSPDEPEKNNKEHKADGPDSEDKLSSSGEIRKVPSMDSLLSVDEVSESGLDGRDEEDEELMELKQKLREREMEILAITKEHQASEDKKMAEIKELEDKVTSLKLELNAMDLSKAAFEEQVDKTMEENSGLNVRITELEDQFRENANQLQTLIGKLEEDKKGLKEQNDFLQKELEVVSHQRSEFESELTKKSQEVSECLVQIENLTDKLASKVFQEEQITTGGDNVTPQAKIEELELEIGSLSSQKKELENQIISTKSEAYRLRAENERLYARIFVLETTIKGKEKELSALQDILEVQENEMSSRVRSLTEELQNLRQEQQVLQHEKTGLQMQLKKEKQECTHNLTHTKEKNIELKNKVADQQKSLAGLEKEVNKLTEENKQAQSKFGDAKSNYQIAERKVEEMAEEFFKKCEDKLRMLSRRIRVAEQLHVENKEWYLKTRDRYEQQNKELKERLEKNEIWLRNIKDLSLTADNTLSALDGVALKFQGRTANFQNRISKVSCELKFAKDWIRRKNKAIAHVRDDLSCLLAQLDDKEAEILKYREKVWKSENKVRELEKLMNVKEEGMLALKEEKREAIRQLCVWIDYHRSHSDYYKKILSDMNVASKKTR